MRSALVRRPIDVGALIVEVSDASNGAVSLFVGTVRSRNDGRDVLGIEYSAYDSMAEKEMTDILSEAHGKFGVAHVAVEHRLGKLAIGEASVVIAVADPHRAAAIDATRYIIEELKRRVPIWKLELYADGTREWVAAAPVETL